MYYTNSMKVTLKNAEAATKALKILRTRLTEGFDCDKGYARMAAMLKVNRAIRESKPPAKPEA